MKSIVFVFIGILFSTCVFAQSLPLHYDTLERDNSLVFTGNVDYNSSGIQREISSKFIRGGFIDDKMKDASFSKHKGVNRAGFIGEGELVFRNYKQKIIKNWGWQVKAGYGSYSGMIYSKDLFGLVFYGNDRYKGQTVDLSGTNFLSTTFQKIGFGLINERSKSNITLNFYNISSRYAADLRDVSFIQDSQNDQIDLTLEGTFEARDNAKFSQGIGVGFDLDFKIPFNFNNKVHFIQVDVRNLGFSYMHSSQKKYTVDTSFIFSGFKLDDLIGDNALFSDSISVLDELGVDHENKKSFHLLPGFIQVAKIVDDMNSGKIQSFFGVRVYPTLIFAPHVFVGVDYAPISMLRIGLSGAYGGYGGFRAGLYASLKVKKYSIGISSENVVGFFTKKSFGQSLNLRFRCGF